LGKFKLGRGSLIIVRRLVIFYQGNSELKNHLPQLKQMAYQMISYQTKTPTLTSLFTLLKEDPIQIFLHIYHPLKLSKKVVEVVISPYGSESE